MWINKREGGQDGKEKEDSCTDTVAYRTGRIYVLSASGVNSPGSSP